MPKTEDNQKAVPPPNQKAQVPTVGRVVLYYDKRRNAAGEEVLTAQAATVASIREDDGRLQLGVLDPNGHQYAATNVPQQAADATTDEEKYHTWTWPPRV